VTGDEVTSDGNRSIYSNREQADDRRWRTRVFVDMVAATDVDC